MILEGHPKTESKTECIARVISVDSGHSTLKCESNGVSGEVTLFTELPLGERFYLEINSDGRSGAVR